MSETHTYPDGSARVGEPPFPKLSPLEQAQGKKEPEKEPEPEAKEEQRKPGRPKKAE